MKLIHFVCISFVLAGTLAFGQANDRPSLNQLGPKNVRRSEFSFTGTTAPQGPKKTRALAPKPQTPQSAEFPLRTPVNYDTGGILAGAVVAVDVNGDGKPDLVVVNGCGSDHSCFTDGSVGVLLNNGNGTFSTAVTYSSNGWSPAGVAFADVNGDGKPDIVVVNQCSAIGSGYCTTDGTVAVLLGNGDGTFQAAVNYDSGGFQAVSVAIADVNADGHPDLVVLNQCGSSTLGPCASHGTIAVLLGNGDGTFQPALTYDTGGFEADDGLDAEAVAVADLRGDGKLDLVVANACGPPGCANGIPPQPGSVGVLLGNGDGTFQAVTTYPTSAALTGSVAVADLNGDGKLDIVASDDCATTQPGCTSPIVGGHIDVFVGNGDGTFSVGSTYDTNARQTHGVAIADVNGDGIPDLEVVVLCAPYSTTCSFASSVGVLLGNSGGTFQAATYFGPIGNPEGDGAIAGLAVADVDGDGRPDLLLTNSCQDINCLTDGVVGVLINTSTFPNSVSSTTTLASSANPSNVGQSVTFTATVTPSSGGTPTGTVSLFDGSTNLGLFALNSSGIATVANKTLPVGANSINATYNGDASLTPSTSAALSQVVLGFSLSSTSLNFATQNVGTTSGPQTVTLTNTEKTSIAISSISITGANSGNFAQTNNCPSALPANGSCTVSVTFTPSAPANFVANLSISDSFPGSPQVVALSGSGVIPPVSLSPLNLTFPDQYVGTSGLPQSLTLTNNSVSSVTISSVTTSTADFGSLNACGSTVASGSSCSIGVFFDPTQAGTRTGTLTVTTNPAAPLTATLTGMGQDFSLASSSPSATVTPGQTATYTVKVSPLGGFNQTVSLSCSGAPAQSTCSLSSDSVTLNGSAPASVTVTVATAGNSAALAPPSAFPNSPGALLLCMTLFGLPGLLVLRCSTARGSKRRSRFVPLLGLCVALFALSWLGCGGSGSNGGGGGTPPATYNLSLTGTFASGSTTLTHSAKLTLVVE
ncbi:MAG: FG-GAP-like repeat-containing protein [Candidatus Sulfotelmatobacter sp.]